MNRVILIISTCILVVNILAGFIISAYSPFNVCFTCGTIAITALLLCLLNRIRLKDGFRIPLFFLFCVCGLVELLLGFISAPKFENNGCLLTALIITVGEIAILLICNLTSKTIQ